MGIADTIAALGGSAMTIAAIRVIYSTGKIVRSQEALTQDFSDHRKETRADAAEFRVTLRDYGERIRVLEYAYGTSDRRHIARRVQDQAHQEEDV